MKELKTRSKFPRRKFETKNVVSNKRIITSRLDQVELNEFSELF